MNLARASRLNRRRAALRRLFGEGGRAPGREALELTVETPPVMKPGPALWRFWLWLIDERSPTLGNPDRGPNGGSIWRVRVGVDPGDR